MKKHSSSNSDVNGGGSRREDFEVAVDVATLQDLSELLHSQPKKLYSESRHRRQIQKIPPHIRSRNIRRSQQVYDPVLVSIGPYHHGKPGLRRAEEFKHLCLDCCAGGDDKKKAFFYSKILEKASAIRDCYAEAEIVEKYDDKSLALMMLLDASIIIDFIHNYLGMKGNNFLDWRRCLGAGSWPLMIRDIMLMENQIPLQVLKLLIAMQYEEGEAASFLPRFFAGFLTCKTRLVGVDLKNAEIPDEIEDPSIHLLEAVRKVIVKKKKKKKKNEIEEQHTLTSEYSLVNKNVFMLSKFPMREETVDAGISYMHRSVMDLKAKGIRIRSDPDLSPGEITFVPGVCFSELHLPIQYLTPVVVENMIAFEVLPHGCSSLVVLSYAIFMKSLVQSPQDVKELQANGVMLNRFGNLENVVQMIKEVDTFGLHDQDIFKDVKRRIEEHCRSKARTWLADLIYSRVRTPWTAIALFAGVLLLCLTFVQTFFTIWPTNQRAL
ncbi:hypothetical protein SASPL_126383 [Salvia splendens]|uniref:Uncharacterized protein n=1 Tax=Salvia splendens TaxID=180675 RepID=A0A8X8ZRN7_SALSN|nr:putative UPF0481 protein At3g02645 [Salvia splendens]KAG6413669.1 hypothetical protein SASPL_126383 [Salvia splendens]